MIETQQLIGELLRFSFKQAAATEQGNTSEPHHPWIGGLVGFIIGVFCGVFVPMIGLRCMLALSAPLTDLWMRHNPVLSILADVLWLFGVVPLWIILILPYRWSEHRSKLSRVAYLVGAALPASAWTLLIVFLPWSDL